MDDMSLAIAGIIQSTADMAKAWKGLDENLTLLVASIRARDQLLIDLARRYPHASPAEIILAAAQMQTPDRGAPQ